MELYMGSTWTQCVLHWCRQPNHPICIIKQAIVEYFEANYPGRFTSFDDLYPIVSTKAVSLSSALLFFSCVLACCTYPSDFIEQDKVSQQIPLLQNFDDVLTPIDHVSRNPNDTYYVDKDTVCIPHLWPTVYQTAAGVALQHAHWWQYAVLGTSALALLFCLTNLTSMCVCTSCLHHHFCHAIACHVLCTWHKLLMTEVASWNMHREQCVENVTLLPITFG